MQLEVGSILEGRVTGITKFGAFIELPGGKTGMVHISEVASSYVKEITDYLSMNQMVKVKIIGITPEGKVSLSISRRRRHRRPRTGSPLPALCADRAATALRGRSSAERRAKFPTVLTGVSRSQMKTCRLRT